MEITSDVRAAVLAEQCGEVGHDFSMQNMITGGGMTAGNQVIMRLGGGDDRAPHLSCRRCGTTWLLVEVSGTDYAAAETDLIARLGEADALRAALIARRDRRTATAAGIAALTAEETSS